jgi:DNA-binding beta-propeller fold protein YncE
MARARVLMLVLPLVASAAAACGGEQPPPQNATPKAQPVAQGSTSASCTRARSTPVATPPADAKASSTVAVATLGQQTVAYVADEDTKSIRTVDVDANKELATTPLGGRPGHLIVLPDGRVAVGIRDTSKVEVYEPADVQGQRAPLDRRCTVDVAPEPVAFAVTPDGSTLLVSSGWGRALGAFDAASLSKKYQVALPREPRAVVVSDDGKTAYVTHAVGGQVSRVDLAKQEATPVKLHGLTHQEQREAANQPSPDFHDRKAMIAFQKKMQRQEMQMPASCQGFALAKTSAPAGRILAPQVLVDPGDPEQQPGGYGNDNEETEHPDVAVIDSQTGTPFESSIMRVENIRRSPLEAHNDDCLLPRAAAFDASTRSLLVACYGVDAVIAYDATAASPAVAEKRRWLVASGPSGVAVDPNKHRAFVWSQFDRKLTTLKLDGPEIVDDGASKPTQPTQLALAPDAAHPVPVALALGRMLFHSVGDARISRDGRACASCHPDGRDDSLTWATPEGPRRSIMLADRVGNTSPYSWDGSEHTLEEHLDLTFQRLHGAGGLRSLELEALTQYVHSLAAPPPLPRGDENKIKRGAELFASTEVGCSKCHAGADLTDNEHHDVQSKTQFDQAKAYNTPTLKHVGGTGPYFHDGRYKTLRELLKAEDGKMGHTSQLNDDDLDALETYVRSL